MSQKPLIHFEISERKVLLRLFDMLGVLLTLAIVGIIFKFDYFKIDTSNWSWTLVFLIYLNLFGNIFELYDLQKADRFDSVIKNVLLTTSLTVLFYILTPFFTPSLPENRLQILFFFISVAGALLIWRFLYINLISSPRFYKRVLVVGDTFDIKLIAESLQKSDPNYFVVGYIHTDQRFKTELVRDDLIRFEVQELQTAIKQHHINEVLVASAYQKGLMFSLYNQLNELLKRGFPVREYTQVYEEVTRRIPVQNVDKDFYRYFPFSRSNQNKFYILIFRVLDIIVSIIGIIFGLVISPLIFIGNLVANRGKFFYTQERVGKNGVVFNILKLRTMNKDAESTGPQYAQKNDFRITRFGKFLRRARIDEIPQFYNVLKGDMSLIGPRPERPIFVKELSELIPFYDTRHIIKPGLTGWAQVMANYGDCHDDSLVKLQYDLYYIKHRGIFLDLSILLKTLSTVIFFRGQ
ncbi:exopolysaccharide biosynthesis polyprenyl glycosylphosphotransferase [Christiangramia echinicola]|uniref:Exopolysaccharide biosynthesis polyprenyl glycosylphosphotransferase n=1 Tax=Christiangramia echinicola TaxID=279359 RepID=A0A1H1L347_9FLAO|nr:exopolysaccharide biosynthesis polyprenyl glycosylphosphotransferase [Christiangramia echinicola]SDR68750.1 exopolysaccharide biosynthesis polyprenyl glycosylphosphotransferase [Christiangramia echinicola]